MCTASVPSYTNSRYISKLVPQNVMTHFPCGMCADCIRKQRSQWTLRAFYEAKRCFNSSGAFVLFDTLTYSDDNIRDFHDVYFGEASHPGIAYNPLTMAFSRPDLQKFFKRLRKNLDAAGYDHKGKLRYFVTSEYGTSEEYKGKRCTHRPHYHCLFYVSFDIDPLVLSRMISSSWPYGKTDGDRPYKCGECKLRSCCPSKNPIRWCLYKSKRYVLEKRVFRASNPDFLKLTNYVSKYVSKDLYSYKDLFGRLYAWFSVIYPDWQQSYKLRCEFSKLRHSVLPFHLQSQGFGDFALESEDPEYIDRYGAIRMPVADGVIASIPLSQFFRRRLYFNHQKIDGHVVWRPNQRYYRTKIDNFNRSVFSLRNRLFSYDHNIGLQKATDIAIYSLLYKGKICQNEDLNLSPKDFLLKSITPSNLSLDLVNNNVWLNYNHRKHSDDRGYYWHSTIKQYFLHGYYNNGRYVTDGNRSWSHFEFVTSPPDGYVVISSATVSKFKGFDSFLEFFDKYNITRGRSSDVLLCSNEIQHDRYKILGFIPDFL